MAKGDIYHFHHLMYTDGFLQTGSETLSPVDLSYWFIIGTSDSEVLPVLKRFRR